jgi:hypothetical protein
MSLANNKSLEESINAFAEPEFLIGNDAWEYAPGGKIPAERAQHVQTFPSILVFHLARFDHDAETSTKSKVQSHFTFPLRLEMETWNEMDTSVLYALNGVVLHLGTVKDGHYVSIVKIDGQWIRFDDHEVTQITEVDVFHESFGGDETFASAYLLFYVKIDSESEEIPVLAPVPIVDNPDIRKLVVDDNEMFALEQIAFRSYFAPIVLEFGSDQQLWNFVFRVLCHSKLLHLIPDFQARLLDRINDYQDLLNFLIN